MRLPIVAITLGDPAGVGPELAIKILETPKPLTECVPVVFGSRHILERVAEKIGCHVSTPTIDPRDWEKSTSPVEHPVIIDVATAQDAEFTPGSFSALTGAASYQYINSAIDAALAGRVDAVVTGPIQKEALHLAGIRVPGHTEIFAARAGSDRYCMMLTSDSITCSLVTTHVGLLDVGRELSRHRVLDVIQLSAEAMRRMRGRAPRLTVCGLNPHAGENGLFGNREEETIIKPALEDARGLGINVTGPLSPDTAFVPQRRERTDCYICMYHDQGLIPLKALAFDTAVNVTLGLPFVRTSPDHGTAMDIAWKGTVNPSSMLRAVSLAASLAMKRIMLATEGSGDRAPLACESG